MGKSGRYRKRRRPPSRQQAKRLSQREREAGLKTEDRRDYTVDLPTPLMQARRKQQLDNRKKGAKS